MGVFPMRTTCALLGVALLLAGLTTAAGADEKCQQLLEQAIKAHGADKLEKQPASIWKGKGTIQLTGMKIPFTGEWTVGGPNKMRIDLQMEIGGDRIQILTIYNGKQGWTVFGGDVNDLEEDALEEMKETAY